MKENDIVQAVKRSARTRPDKTEDFSVQVEPGEMGRMTLNALVLFNLPPIDTDDPKQVEARIQEYFDICVERDMKPSVTGMALALGISRMTLWEWRAGRKHKSKEIIDTIKRAHAVLNFMMEDWMLNGKINPVSGIFLSKNNFGYSDKSELEITPKQPLGDTKTREEIERKYLESVDDPEPSDIIYAEDTSENDET